MNTLKGYEFEQEVEATLRNLEKKFPDIVKVIAQREFSSSPRPHQADFEFEYKLGGLTHQHLIECQNRNRSSYDLADKIYAVRGTSDRHRYIFVYKDSQYLDNPVAKRLEDMGVLPFGFNRFKAFLNQLEADIALRKIGLAVLESASSNDDGSRPDAVKCNGIVAAHLKSAAKHNPEGNSPVDRAMISNVKSYQLFPIFIR